MFYSGCFSLARDLRALSADRRETLPRDRKYVLFHNLRRKILRVFPHAKKIGGQKTCKIRRDFGQLQTSIANISGTDGNINNRKTNISTAVPPAFAERRPVNFGPLTNVVSVTCHIGSRSLSSTCHPTQVNVPHLNPSQTGQYSIYLLRRDGRLS